TSRPHGTRDCSSMRWKSGRATRPARAARERRRKTGRARRSRCFSRCARSRFFRRLLLHLRPRWRIRVPTTTLEYRRPRGLDRNERSLAQIVQLRERAYHTAAWAILALGIAGLLLAPILAAGIAVSVEARFHPHLWIGWWSCFAIAAATLVPLFFW